MSNSIRRRYNDYVKNAAPDDFSAQVRRTVNGQAIGEDQIQMIVDAILRGIDLHAADVVLDLCCGNGVLTDRVFDRCAGGLGVDFSEALIEVAQRHFQALPQRAYLLSDVVDFAERALPDHRLNKALCYGSFAHFTDEMAVRLLSSLRSRFPAIRRFMIGNVPDKARMHAFYYEDAYLPGIENDHESALGIWRTEAELAELAQRAGWNATFSRMPAEFHAAHYRYDALLTAPS